MANQHTKFLEITQEAFIEGFDAECGISMAVKTAYPDPKTMQQAQDVYYRPQELALTTVSGLDISGSSASDIIQRQVPTVLRTPENVKIRLTGSEMRNPDYLRDAGKAAAKQLAALIDTDLINTMVANAGITVKKVGAFAWTDGAQAETLLYQRGNTGVKKFLALNATDYLAVAQDLGNKAYMGDLSKSAYEQMLVPDIAKFTTMRYDNAPNVTLAGTVSGTTINGNQSHTVTAMTGDLPTDNRTMVLNVAGANIANIKAGDRLQVAGVNAVHRQSKVDTGVAFTAVVKSVAGGGANLTISPPIISSGPYQNASAQAANGAAVTFLNTATKPANLFFTEGAVCLDFGNVVFDQSMGQKVMPGRTKQGVPLVMVAQSNAMGGYTDIRFTTRYGTTVLEPEKVGIILANQ